MSSSDTRSAHAGMPTPNARASETPSADGGFPRERVSDVLNELEIDLRANALYRQVFWRYAMALESHPQATERHKAAWAIVQRLDRAAALEPSDLPVLEEMLYFAQEQRLLAKHNIHFPAYDIQEEYFINTCQPWGPNMPRERAGERTWSFLGRRIGFPIGVPASVLTPNPAWVSYWARSGYNVITYKTVRSRATLAYELPNWIFVPNEDRPRAIADGKFDFAVDDAYRNNWLPAFSTNLSSVNSFGVPSLDPIDWTRDIENALVQLSDDQLLIVSVMGDL